MDLTFRIDDDLFAQYKAEALERKITIGEIFRQRLKTAIALDPRDKWVVLSDGRCLQQIEEHLGGGDLQGSEDLLRKVKRLASISFGEHEFKLTPGQFQELKFRAEKTGRSHAELCAEIWRRVSEDFFKYTP